MPLTPCPDCGREISPLAPACIHCGRPAQRYAASAPSFASAAAGCPLCGAEVTHPNARTGGKVWCERCGGEMIFGTDGALVRALPREQAAVAATRPLTPVVLVNRQKSVGTAALLAFLFGPLGMIYSTPGGAGIMFLVSLFAMALTFGLGLFVTWPICVVWAAHAATEHNRRLAYGAQMQL